MEPNWKIKPIGLCLAINLFLERNMKTPPSLLLFWSSSLSTFVVFKSGEWRFKLWDGSSRQLFPTNNKRGSTQTRITKNIYTSTGQFGAMKHTYNTNKPKKKCTNKLTKQEKFNNTTEERVQHPFLYSTQVYREHPTPSQKPQLDLPRVIFWGAKSRALKATIPQSELTIMDRVSFQISSIQAGPQYAEYQMVRTKLVQIFPFNPLGPLPTAHLRGGAIQPCLYSK